MPEGVRVNMRQIVFVGEVPAILRNAVRVHRCADVFSAVLHKEEISALPVAPSLARGFAERLPVFVAVLLQKLCCLLWHLDEPRGFGRFGNVDIKSAVGLHSYVIIKSIYHYFHFSDTKNNRKYLLSMRKRRNFVT